MRPPARARRHARRRGAVLAAALLAAVVPAACGSSRQAVAEAAPRVELESLQPGAPPVTLPQPGRPLVVNFFASWCAPCRRELPALQEVFARHGEQVAFVGVAHQDKRDAALATLAEAGVTYPAGFDPSGRVARRYRLIGMPSTVFVSAEGEVLERRTGELTVAELERELRRLFR